MDIRVFLDCDGVLADFDTAARQLLGECPREHEAREGGRTFWKRIRDHGSFYADLPLMPDARQLYEGVAHLNPSILTGCPRGDWSQPQKRKWAERNFPGVELILCKSANKRLFGKPGDVLIDDWPQYKPLWLEMGGVWIDHVNANQSLEKLWSVYPDLRP